MGGLYNLLKRFIRSRYPVNTHTILRQVKSNIAISSCVYQSAFHSLTKSKYKCFHFQGERFRRQYGGYGRGFGGGGYGGYGGRGGGYGGYGGYGGRGGYGGGGYGGGYGR